MLDEITRGLKIHQEDPHGWDRARCSLRMLDCCLDKVPSGNEHGTFCAIDFGGTNLRVVHCQLDGQGHAAVTQLIDNIRDDGVCEDLPEGVRDSKAPASMLFDAIALRMKTLLIQTGDLENNVILPVGFTFSFGIRFDSLNKGISLTWAKEFATGIESDDPVIGRDVVALMNEAFERNEVPAKVNCILNDTTGTLIAGAIECDPSDPECRIALIVGTGVNCCYFDSEAKSYGYLSNVINMESGEFNKGLPVSVVDNEIDFESNHHGHMMLEKISSGLYLAQIIQKMIVRCCQYKAPPAAWEKDSLLTPDCAAIYADNGIDMARRVMMSCWQWEASDAQLEVVKRLVDAAFDRSAALQAVVVAAATRRVGLPAVTVAVDGSLFSRNPKYQRRLGEFLAMILDSQYSVSFTLTSDGSGKGAACLAAMIAQSE
eukprot:Protomagalhaensia_sp_Gyna_25__1093@NODE_1532_length_1758_cov_186_328679_g1244_i0_p1_GENE_NODE_1532_length_1758_cov_186_328679_g1244_i0NODE_1532_length_1758_cov_186_328679_g1244_i0_p1_ORF_typecomplete_len430_score47_39Hexokinase_1/PF00349_21/8_3e43Hexokinase_2/PF03727_16/1_9e40BcrAD_BadFG/PF01869_20/0_21BcrAD_BadFG/PF01869_20/23CTXphi_pIIIN1/PF16710_5/0_36_NODE_1532_length_1758_cov_186_328679_g1244_i01291418